LKSITSKKIEALPGLVWENPLINVDYAA